MQETNQPTVTQTPTSDPIAAAPVPQPVVSGQVIPMVNKSGNNNCLIFAILGCLGFFVFMFVLVMIVIVAINPAGRIKQQQEKTFQSNVLTASLAVDTCITSELAKSTKPTVIYSDQACANKTFLETNSYLKTTDTVKIAGVTITSNETKSKICAYQAVDSTNVVSWDTSTRVVSANGQGKNTCL